jgi:predicted O-methyltransferase YrrM
MNKQTELNIPGWFDWADWAKETIAALPAGAVYVEVGCFLGKSTAAIAQMIQASGKQIALHAVDTFCVAGNGDPALLQFIDKGTLLTSLPPQYDFKKQFEANLKAAGVRKLVKVVQRASVEAAKAYVDGGVDVVFIDADHSYEAVRADSAAWWPKLKPGGIMAGHDIHTYDSVWRAVHDEFKIQNAKLKVEVIGNQNIWVIRKP